MSKSTVISNYIQTIEDMLSSLKESINDTESISEKWNCIDKFMIDIERIATTQPVTSRKGFLLKDILSGEMDGNTKYPKHFASMPIMINSIINEDNTLSPSKVSEMHVENIDGQLCLLLTPEIIGY